MADEERSAYDTALRILGGRGHSVLQLRRKLAAKRFEAKEIDETIERLRADRLIDDLQFAADFARSRIRQSLGSKRIRRELEAAGVKGAPVELAIRSASAEEGEEERLRLACRKKIDILVRRHGAGFLRSAQGRRKLYSFLLNRGYEPSLIIAVMDESAGEQADEGSIED
jgi:regulatory protein